MKTHCCLLLLCASAYIDPSISLADEARPQVETLFSSADKNGDGKVTPQELGRPYLFQRLDRNRDGSITLEEARRARPANANLLRDISYGSHQSQKLDFYLPGENIEDSPIMVYVHGGGWQKGDKSSVGQKAKFFNDKGWVFVSVNYRLIPGGEHPKNVQDVATAISFVLDQAAEKSGDPNQLFIMGHSAGCHLVSLVATDQRHLEKVGKSLSDIKGVIALDTQTYDIPMLMAGAFTSPTYGRVFTTDPEVQKDASPSHHVAPDKSIPPFLICYSSGIGNRPNPNRPRVAVAFAEKLRQAGYSAEVVDASDRNHGQINQRFGDPDDEKVTGKAMQFLERILEVAPGQSQNIDAAQ